LSGTPSAEGIRIADLNGDGRADLIGFDGSNLVIWPGTGDANFGGSTVQVSLLGNSVNPLQMQIADMDGDGRPDIVLPGAILYNDGNFTFTFVQVESYTTDYPFAIGDFNHDGLLDIVSGSVTWLGRPNRTLSRVTPNNLAFTSGLSATVGDINQDGYSDLVFGGNGEPVMVYYSKGDGTFYQQTELNVGPEDYSQALEVADFNGDGRPDIVACLFLSQQCVLYTNDGTGGFQRSYLASGSSSTAVLAVDLTGQAKLDLVISNYGLGFRPPNFNVILHQ
jgi:hypothetical protein